MNEPLTAIRAYRPVDDFIATSGQPTVDQLATIASAGFDTIINLALHDDPRYSLADEPGAVRSLGLEYVHIPVQFAAPTEDNLLAFFSAIDARENEMVWIHCAANIRVSTFLGLYRATRQGWEVHRAFELMRSVWQPDVIWSSFVAEMLRKHRTT